MTMTFEELQPLKTQFKSQTTNKEAEELYNTIISSCPGDVVEIGSAWGGTTIVLVCAGEIASKTIYSIDPYPVELEGVAAHFPIGLCKDLKDGFTANILNGKYSNVFQFNEDATVCAHKIPNELSVVFIDGLHEFENVKRELDTMVPKIASGGFLFIHDTDWTQGQLTGTYEESLANIYEWIKNYPVKDVTRIDSMLKCQKI
jgi:cephalosporin hydroxylase